MPMHSAYFVGDGTLLIRCAEAFLQAGGEVAGVVAADPQIIAWAREQGHPVLGVPSRPELPAAGADYLFSVANLTVLGSETLAAARKMAINFHDGPLPERGGVNAPAWAILEGAEEHAVTWHEMVATVDAGRVIKSRRFAIAPNETAFSLNLRCYEAGEETFRALLADIAAGELHLEQQSGERGWYARARRPASLGVLDFARPASELCRTARGLDFGARRNPLALPKVLVGDQVLAIRKLERVGEGRGEPGQILGLDERSITVMAADEAVMLSGLTEMGGGAVNPMAFGVSIGAMLPRFSPGDVIASQSVGASEAFWEAALENANALLPPYPNDHSAPAGRAELAIEEVSAAALGAAWAAWLACATGQRRVTLASDAEPGSIALSRRRPVTVELDPADTAQAVLVAYADALRRAEAHAPMAADLPLRLEGQTAAKAPVSALGTVVSVSPAAKGDITLSAAPPTIDARAGLYSAEVLAAIAADFSAFCRAFIAAPHAVLSTLPLGEAEASSGAGGPVENPDTIHELIARTAQEMPDAVAVEEGGRKITNRELDERAARLAGALAAHGARPGAVVGLHLGRGADLVVSMLAILKTGAAYLPLDPTYPAERIAFMLEDSGAALVVADTSVALPTYLDAARVVSHEAEQAFAGMRGAPTDLAYLIYTSGSTGRPKGVMIEHRNVTNFFAGMDRAAPLERGARLLAVTSISFDISVLELLWTLARGATIVLQAPAKADIPAFSLFYFAAQSAAADDQAYRVLFEGARFADQNGFEAIWTPERHFHEFGGLYPNPAISSAALAGMTKNVKLRAGSVVAPLHHPVSIAENWSLVDNLSGGRAGIAIASGWQPDDFVLRPENFAQRKSIAVGTVDTLRRLWAGEAVAFPGQDGKPVPVSIHPRPLQKEIPIWITAAGNVETFAEAGRLGCGVLTHLLGQSIEDLREKIGAYRQARATAGFHGDGHVVLMLHTFVSDDEEAVLATARQPMKSYLGSAVDLVRRASWTFPTFVSRAEASGRSPQEVFDSEDLTADELDALLDHAFERYHRRSGLFGTPETAKEIVREVQAVGVDEIACLIDFGIDAATVLDNLKHIRTLMNELEKEGGGHKSSVAEDVVRYGVTHLQCTPSMAGYLTADAAGERALQQLHCLMVGGEALPPDLARDLRANLGGRLLNMYGPTETTIWSSVAALDEVGERVPLGQPIANTHLSVRAPGGQVAPPMMAGELWIAGAGVSRGYWERPELTAERFVEREGRRWYRTGDLVRMQGDGVLEFLGRIDNQVKIRGHRIELGEIEAVIAEDEAVRQAAVKVIEFGAGDARLVAYVTAGASQPSERQLRGKLAEKLPEFMRPSHIVILDRMPTTPNGKVDRQALPPPKAISGRGEMVAAAGDAETAVAAIWKDALGLEEISVTENVFDLGAHSLLAVQIQRRMKEHFARDIAITDIFRFPTVRAIAAHLSSEPAGLVDTAADRGAARAAARLARMGRR